MKNAVIILAAGRGTRAGIGLPKTYRMIDNQSILRTTLNCFLELPIIDAIQVVIHPDDSDLYHDAIKGADILSPVYGGDTRAKSVYAGLKALVPHTPQNILIHDGARPFVSSALINRCIDSLTHYDGVIPALKNTDALWREENGQLIESLPKSSILRAQTPQAFHFEKYYKIANSNPLASDDAEIAIEGGLKIGWVEGDVSNIKLTFPEDFK